MTADPTDSTAPPPARGRRHDDRGEGVISAAIVVLIMALIGAAMWVTFDGLWTDVSTRTEEQVDRIGGG